MIFFIIILFRFSLLVEDGVCGKLFVCRAAAPGGSLYNDKIRDCHSGEDFNAIVMVNLIAVSQHVASFLVFSFDVVTKHNTIFLLI